MFYNASDFRKGIKIIFKGKPFEIIECSHYKPGKGAAIIKSKLRNLCNKLVITQNFRVSEKIMIADISYEVVKFVYKEKSHCIFISESTQKRLKIKNEILEKNILFLKKHSNVTLKRFNNKIIDVIIEKFILLKVIAFENEYIQITNQNGLKKALLETGLHINVPSFIKENDIIRIDTKRKIYICKDKYDSSNTEN